jgi:hypothetical protein
MIITAGNGDTKLADSISKSGGLALLGCGVTWMKLPELSPSPTILKRTFAVLSAVDVCR